MRKLAARVRTLLRTAINWSDPQRNRPLLGARSQYKRTWQHLATSDDNARLYVAGTKHEEELGRSGRHTVEILEKLIRINASDVILEIGCGVGRVGKILSPRCSKWIGTDISSNMLHYAAERLAGLDNIELVELSTVGLKEISDNSIDAVYCTVVFMHLYEWDRYRYVKEAFRVLKAGGRCFFDNIDITSKHGWKVFLEASAYDLDKRPAHLSMTSSGDELETYLLRAGFDKVKIHRWDEAWVGATGVKPDHFEDV